MINTDGFRTRYPDGLTQYPREPGGVSCGVRRVTADVACDVSRRGRWLEQRPLELAEQGLEVRRAPGLVEISPLELLGSKYVSEEVRR